MQLENLWGNRLVKDYLYPNIIQEENIIKKYKSDQGGEYFLKLTSILRRKHTDGKWYLVPFVRHHSYFFHDDAHLQTWRQEREVVINKFHTEVYRFIIAGRLDPNMKTSYPGFWGDEKWLKLDDIQEEELDRIKKMF